MKKIDLLIKLMKSRPYYNGMNNRELELLLKHYGFELKRTNGSHKHYVLEIDNCKYYFTNPTHRANDIVRACYIKELHNILVLLDLI